jgi:DNA repair exonuclease SbcCD ATPase subunit
LSTLTKVLIVLQVVVALVLCGLVVTYVATADNYKQMYEGQSSKARQAEQQRQKAEQDLEQLKTDTAQETAGLSKKIAGLNDRISDLGNNLGNLERDKTRLNETVTTMASTIEAANINAEKQTELAQKAQEQLDALRSEQVKKDGQLKEINDALVERTVVISTQTEQIKRLTEERTELQAKLEQALRQYGKVVVPPVPAQPQPVVQQPGPAVKDLNLRGTVTRVDLEGGLAEISIGSADGVKQGMELYVTRGDQFMCNILVLDVQAERAVGVLKLVQQSPRAGDVVTTNL